MHSRSRSSKYYALILFSMSSIARVLSSLSPFCNHLPHKEGMPFLQLRKPSALRRMHSTVTSQSKGARIFTGFLANDVHGRTRIKLGEEAREGRSHTSPAKCVFSVSHTPERYRVQGDWRTAEGALASSRPRLEEHACGGKGILAERMAESEGTTR